MKYYFVKSQYDDDIRESWIILLLINDPDMKPNSWTCKEIKE
jgi:hypothetical protein